MTFHVVNLDERGVPKALLIVVVCLSTIEPTALKSLPKTVRKMCQSQVWLDDIITTWWCSFCPSFLTLERFLPLQALVLV